VKNTDLEGGPGLQRLKKDAPKKPPQIIPLIVVILAGSVTYFIDMLKPIKYSIIII
jgi:hypothetical protein